MFLKNILFLVFFITVLSKEDSIIIKKLRNADSLILTVIVFAALMIFQYRNILNSTLCLGLSLKTVNRAIISKGRS